MAVTLKTIQSEEVEPNIDWYQGQVPQLQAGEQAKAVEHKLLEIKVSNSLTLGFEGHLETVPMPGQQQSNQVSPVGPSSVAYQLTLSWRF
ncbi:hypothetical protein PVT67_17815 [Gallaecimonas kandeliae]|uniref:hypothetical protein n=1 Tax=Gallaecimonas kandeliae TaxID=3029055 RepID=UPI002647A634|nr:hypothetical protein [Gallaecimonas kandeliae]WKE65500.1 hypothetical protein PVT67_17815 [Gallaecimonas kandeliae]